MEREMRRMEKDMKTLNEVLNRLAGLASLDTFQRNEVENHAANIVGIVNRAYRNVRDACEKEERTFFGLLRR
jgi:hypothetical protein